MVLNTVLQNESYVTTSAAFDEFKLLGDRGMKSQSSASFYDDKTGVLFYTMVSLLKLFRRSIN